MVFFTCNACGASLKKNQVEKHYMHQCRQCEVLTCIDCHKDFPGDSYRQHTSCISEEEKYSAKGWQPKANANKGAKKQAAWLERLEKLIEDKSNELDKDVKQVLSSIQGYENIPRKRPKFINFCKNVCARKFPPATIEKTWDVFAEALKDPEQASSANNVANGKGKENGKNESNGAKQEQKPALKEDGDEEESRGGVQMFKGTNQQSKKSKKRKADDEEKEESGDENSGVVKKARTEVIDEATQKFDWIKCASAVIAKKGPIKLKKLKKRAINEFLEHTPDNAKTVVQLEAKFEKKLLKCKKFKITNDVVAMSTSRE